MHEHSLTAGLIKKITDIARINGAEKVVRVTVRLGALCHISADHFREHFEEAARGTVADGSDLVIESATDTQDPTAQDILLLSVDVEEE